MTTISANSEQLICGLPGNLKKWFQQPLSTKHTLVFQTSKHRMYSKERQNAVLVGLECQIPRRETSIWRLFSFIAS